MVPIFNFHSERCGTVSDDIGSIVTVTGRIDLDILHTAEAVGFLALGVWH